MRAAEARRAASTITSSSIRLSLAGGHVDCTMNTSRPRTFSISSTLISPSLKRPTYARPSGVCRLRAMSCANAGVALPANSASVSLGVLILYARRAAFRTLALAGLAGVEGFEPPNGGIKTRCLTTWRHPNCLTVRARAEFIQQGRLVQPARDERTPLIRHPRRHALRVFDAREFREHARSRTREARRP